VVLRQTSASRQRACALDGAPAMRSGLGSSRAGSQGAMLQGCAPHPRPRGRGWPFRTAPSPAPTLRVCGR